MARCRATRSRAYLEFDLFGGGSNQLGNEAATNTYALTLRQAYVTWDKWLAGQTWSNFQDVAALPDAVDFVGPTEGTIFVRQAQLRYTSGAFSVALENPQTTVLTNYRATTRINSDDSVLPDITARWTEEGRVGPLQRGRPGPPVAPRDRDDVGQRQRLRRERVRQVQHRQERRHPLHAHRRPGHRPLRRLRLGADGVLDATASDIDGTGVLAGFVAWRHVFDPKLRGNLMFSRAQFDNDTDWTGFGVTQSAQSIHANLIYSPFPKLDIGAELIWGNREVESGADGDLRRLHTTVKYSF